MNSALLQVDGVRVDYEDVTAVDDVSFAVEAGMVYGLIGPNGAGKTSIIRAIANLVEPTWGRIRVAGTDLLEEPRGALLRVGFMPDFPPLYADLTVREFLELFASAYGVPRGERAGRIGALVEQVQLGEKMDAAAGTLSRGMKQRLFLAKTLLHDPDVLLLDEPASGLDPRARMDLRDTLVALGEAGKAVLVSSHILAEMTDFCNAVGIMEQGRMVLSGRIEDVLKTLRPGRHTRLRLVAADDRLGAFLAAREGVSAVETDGPVARFVLGGAADEAVALLRALIGAGFAVVDFHEESHRLEDIFLQVSKGVVS
jgi:ABC-2 type transport system ATP-binding protein